MSQYPSWMETSKARGAPTLCGYAAALWHHYKAQLASRLFARTRPPVLAGAWKSERGKRGWGSGEEGWGQGVFIEGSDHLGVRETAQAVITLPFTEALFSTQLSEIIAVMYVCIPSETKHRRRW